MLAVAGLLFGALAPSSSSARTAVTGRNVTYVSTGGDNFSMRADGSWVEWGAGGTRFSFVEAGRDADSVLLRDESRGVRLQINVTTSQILYGDTTSPQLRLLYKIAGVSAAPPAPAPAAASATPR